MILERPKFSSLKDSKTDSDWNIHTSLREEEDGNRLMERKVTYIG